MIPHRLPQTCLRRVHVLALGLVFAWSSLLAHAATDKKSFDVPAGVAPASLKQFAEQAGGHVLYSVDDVTGVKTLAVKGEFTPREALNRMLAGTTLYIDSDPQTEALTVRKETEAEAKNVSRAIAEPSARPSTQDDHDVSIQAEKVVRLDTFEVFGQKTLNMDIQRSRDDAQPYVTFDRDAIKRSGTSNLEEFLRQRLTMNVDPLSAAQSAGNFAGFSSTFNLRGLGQEQTLVLIDGHRIPDFNTGSVVRQADINSIPVAAVERIEILPATSSGIYGGSATGGVINVILRRDYSGAEVKLTYENTFDTDAAVRRVDISAGETLEGGRTNVLVAASFSDSNHLLARDRDLARVGLANLRANNPATATLFAGSPPLGATPNIRSSNGSNLVLRNGVPLGAPITFVPAGYSGWASDQGAALVPNSGRYNFTLADDATNSGAVFGGGASLLNAPAQESAIVTVRRQFSDDFQAFLELSASNSAGRSWVNFVNSTFTLPASSSANPFQQAILVTVPQSTTDSVLKSYQQNRRVVGGVLVRLPRDWQAEVDLTWQANQYGVSGASALTPAGTSAIATGALNVVRDVVRYPLDLGPYLANRFYKRAARSELRDVAARASGPVLRLPAGPLHAGLMLEQRETDMDATRDVQVADGVYHYYPARHQKVRSAYGEIRAPLLASRFGTASTALELQVAGRWDEYTNDGGATATNVPLGSPPPAVARGVNRSRSANPTFALKLQPMPDVALRVSYGKGFQPPSLTQLVRTTSTFNGSSFFDPRRGNSPLGTFNSISGGNTDLRPERSKSWSAGAIATPRLVPGLRISIDYTKLEKRDNIAGATTSAFQNLLLAEELNPGRVIRGPALPGDPANWAGPVTALDFTLRNIARADLEAVDMQIDFERRTPIGRFALFAMATRTLHYETQLTPAAPRIENVGITRNNPLKLKANGGVSWSSGRWAASWMSHYYDSYLASQTGLVQLNQGNGGWVDSQLYHDVTVTYRFGRSSGRWAVLLDRLEVQIGIKNILNTQPPFDAASTGIFYSTFADPRLARYLVSLTKAY